MKHLLLLILSTLSFTAQAKLNVVTTTTTLKDLAEQVGKNHVSVNSITRANQDPHFVEAKPSYMVKLRNADLIVAVGFDLEIGWLPVVLRGAKNPKILQSQIGYLEATSIIDPIEKVKGKVDRSLGDIHAKGNPHFHLDPVRTQKFVATIASKFGELDPKNAKAYNKNAEIYNKLLNSKMEKWQDTINKSNVKTVVTYHKTLNYFFERFAIKPLDYIEPKPGVPPSAKHVIELIKKMKQNKTNCILNESFFEDNAAKRIGKETKAVVKIVKTEVNSTYIDLMDQLVAAIRTCGKEQN